MQSRYHMRMQPHQAPAAWAAIVLEGHILHLRGARTDQPQVSPSSSNALLWNGEAYEGLSLAADQNDTAVLFKHLCQQGDAPAAVLDTLANIR